MDSKLTPEEIKERRLDERICWKCGDPLRKDNLVLCDKCNSILAEWNRKNKGKYSIKEQSAIRKKWYAGEDLP